MKSIERHLGLHHTTMSKIANIFYHKVIIQDLTPGLVPHLNAVLGVLDECSSVVP
jgi:hypothetical protein